MQTSINIILEDTSAQLYYFKFIDLVLAQRSVNITIYPAAIANMFQETGTEFLLHVADWGWINKSGYEIFCC